MTWYSGNPVYDTLLACGFFMILATVIASPFMASPYGRFSSERFGITMDPRVGWFLMELPATLSFAFFFFTGTRWNEPVPLVFMVVWMIHYAYRGYLFPALMRVHRGYRKSFSILVVAIGCLVTLLHGYFNGYYFSNSGSQYMLDWFRDPRFISGIIIYYSGFILTVHSDSVIRNLRPKHAPGEESSRYRVPEGGGFRLVSCPQYLGELMAWTGFAIFTWSLGGVFILGISAANLVPRAFQTHRWYRENFTDYPRDRRALIPFVL